MKIHVLGTGCAKCQKLYAEVQRAIGQAGIGADLSKVEALEEIVAFGVAFTPGLVIDGEVGPKRHSLSALAKRRRPACRTQKGWSRRAWAPMLLTGTVEIGTAR